MSFLRTVYDRGAADYDARFSALQQPKIEHIDSLLHLDEDARVLDLGCGTGLFSRLTGRRCIGLDLSREMLAQAAGPRLQADMRWLPFEAETFDAIVCVTAILDTPRPTRVLEECTRVLRIGGVLVVSVLRAGTLSALVATANAAQLRVLQTFEVGQDVGLLARREARTASPIGEGHR